MGIHSQKGRVEMAFIPTNFPYPIEPLSQISPFTYRDGSTYLEVLENLLKFLRDDMIPGFNDELQRVYDDFMAGLQNAENTVITTKLEWQALFDAFMADVVSRLEGLNDEAVSNLVNNRESLTGASLYALYLEKNSSRIIAGDDAAPKLRTHDIGSNGTVVALGRDAMGNMEQVKNSIAIGAHAMGDGTISRDNIAIGDEALRVVSAASEDYDQTRRNGTRNIAVGGLAGRMNLDGVGHVFIGRGAGASVEGGNGGVWIGSTASASSQPIGLSGEIENYNHAFPGNPELPVHVVAIGRESMVQNSGRYNVAVGSGSLRNNTKGVYNVALGSNALIDQESNTWYNGGQLFKITIEGRYIHEGNTLTLTLVGHTAVIGDWVSFRLLDGASATFAGDYVFAQVTGVDAANLTFHHPLTVDYAEGFCTTRDFVNNIPQPRVEGNTAIGHASFGHNVSGGHNTGLGMEAGYSNNAGESNVAIGYRAGYWNTGGFNTLVGTSAGVLMIDGTQATALTNVVCLGQSTAVSGNSQVQIGNSTSTVYTYGAVQSRSDARDKADVADTALGLDFVVALRPVDYRWDYREDYPDFTSDGTKKRKRVHHGLIAQEVKAAADALGVDFGGYQDHSVNGGLDVLSVGYEELISPLIKSIQELKLIVDEQQKVINTFIK